MEHGLEYIMFYAQKHMTPFEGLFWSPTGSRQATKSACICETRLDQAAIKRSQNVRR